MRLCVRVMEEDGDGLRVRVCSFVSLSLIHCVMEEG